MTPTRPNRIDHRSPARALAARACLLVLAASLASGGCGAVGLLGHHESPAAAVPAVATPSAPAAAPASAPAAESTPSPADEARAQAARRATADAAAIVARTDVAPDSALAVAEAAARANPNSAACKNNVGIARLRHGDPDRARKAFLDAMALDPSLPGPYYNLAILEKFYALDDAAAARWFVAYRNLASADPDGLAGVLAVPNTDRADGARAGDVP